MSFIAKRYVPAIQRMTSVSYPLLLKCDTFSRSSDAVFELSQRFAETFKLEESLAPEEKLEAERLMFLELTQGTIFAASFMELVQLLIVSSLSLG